MLDIKKEIEDIQRMYIEDIDKSLIKALVIGPTGSGKTRLLETCRRPIHVDSFDQRGTTTIRKGIEEGWIFADTRYEHEDPRDPFAFELWDQEYERRKKGEYFSQIGTYALDGLTMWSESIMNLVLNGLVRKADRAMTMVKEGVRVTAINTEYLRIPQKNDWPLQMNIIRNALIDILTLPCDVIVIGHTEDKKDKLGNVVAKGLYITGKLFTRIPRWFEEIYYMQAVEKSAGRVYHLCTARTDGIDARTRIGRDKFEILEKPDIFYLLEKAGLKPQHKLMTWKEQ